MEKNNIWLIGQNLNSSKSVLIHNTIYNFLNLNLEYKNLEFKDKDDLRLYFENMPEKNFVSNVTFPYKKFLFEYFSNLGFWSSESAKFAGGCNLIFYNNKKMFNYDGLGLINFLQIKNHDVENKKILICGSGITARSIYFSLSKHKGNNIFIASRSFTNINDNINYIGYEELDNKLCDFDLVIDATPIGLEDDPIVDVFKLNRNALVLDVVYGEKDSNLVALSKKRGLVAYNGYGMCVCQAILCIQEICKQLNINNNQLNDFKKLYNLVVGSNN